MARIVVNPAPPPVNSDRCVLSSARAALILAWLLSTSISYYAGYLTRACPSEIVRKSVIDLAKTAIFERDSAQLSDGHLGVARDLDVQPDNAGEKQNESSVGRDGSPPQCRCDELAESNANGAVPTTLHDRCVDQYQALPYKWATYTPSDPILDQARKVILEPTADNLTDTAFVTMASGDSAARGATVLMQVWGCSPHLVCLEFFL